MRRAALLVAAATSGCMSVNSFSSPRPTAPREVSVDLGVNSFVTNGGDSFPIPMPSVGLRTGLVESLDLGFQAAAPGNFRLDVKYGAARGDVVDVGLALGAAVIVFPQNGNGTSDVLLTVDVPLIVGLNVGESVALVPWIAPAFYFEPSTLANVLAVRSGFGVRVRVSDAVVLSPEVSTTWDPERFRPADFAIGFAVGLGAQP